MKIANNENIEYLINDNPVDISHLTDEEAERIFQERFGKYEKEIKSEE